MNLEAVLAEPRVLELWGRRSKLLPSVFKKLYIFEIPELSFRKQLRLNALYKEQSKQTDFFSDQNRELMALIILSTIPTMTQKFIDKHLDFLSFVRVYNFIVEPIKEKFNEYKSSNEDIDYFLVFSKLMSHYHLPLSYFLDQCTENQVTGMIGYMGAELSGEKYTFGEDPDAVDQRQYKKIWGDQREVSA
jgi:hypothetical protein